MGRLLLTIAFLAVIGLNGGAQELPARQQFEIFVPKMYVVQFNEELKKRGFNPRLSSARLTQQVRHGKLTSLAGEFKMACAAGEVATVGVVLSSFFDAPPDIKEDLKAENAVLIFNMEEVFNILLTEQGFREIFMTHIATILLDSCVSHKGGEAFLTATVWLAKDKAGGKLIYVTNPATKELFERVK